MTEAEVESAVVEAIKELTKQIEKQNRILESIDTAIYRGMCQ